MEQERRRSPRFPLIASAEVQAGNLGSRLAARVSDICNMGCYVDTINPLPGGTSVRVKIFSETQSFEAGRTVAYSHAHLGMGLSFSEVPPNSQKVLREWPPPAV
ncbi:MAG TPA: PilZ domain-containing protein [Candidatus Dormibacteraeota bacterium]|nr:PilZ domain-containing protein [Candidatus Dormibacteraeota bacterium]